MKDKKLDAIIEKAYYRHCAGTQINIMDIPKLFKGAREAVAAGQDLDETMKGLIAVYQAGGMR